MPMSALLGGRQRGDATLQEPSDRHGCGNAERILKTASSRPRLLETSVELAESSRQQVVTRERRVVDNAVEGTDTLTCARARSIQRSRADQIATAPCQVRIASARKVRSVDREIR